MGIAASTALANGESRGKLGKLYHDGSSQRPITITLNQGSLKQNVERIARANGWSNLVWKPRHDYKWTGTTKITAYSLQGIYKKMLQHYPVQAVFYEGNHVLVIVPRDLQWSSVS